MDLTIRGETVPLDDRVFAALLDNSVARTYAAYEKAMGTSSITWSDLECLARRGDIPSSLFFAPFPLVQAQIATKTAKLLAGVSKETFSINSRARVELRDVELIVKDLLRKQELLKRHDPTLTTNRIMGILRRPGPSVDADAAKLMDALALTPTDLKAAATKEAAVRILIERLEARQILVSRSVNNFMPQRLTNVRFSGMTIKDSKVPYIFLAGGDHGDAQEPTGRRLFTLALMSVLVSRGTFAPVTYDGASAGTNPPREYDIVGAMLMPRAEMFAQVLESVEQVKKAADTFHVTPSAAAVRAMRLQIITPERAEAHLAELRREFDSLEKPQARQPKVMNALRRYNGREFSRRMLEAYDAGRLSAGEFCRVVCLRKIRAEEIDRFREALR